MSDVIRFDVPGKPEPQGSSRAFVNKHSGRAIVTSDNPALKSWRNRVAAAASDAMAGRELLRGPIALQVTFGMPRPKSHYRANGTLKPNAPLFHTGKPDADKLLRSVDDSLTATVVADDAQVCDLALRKVYSDPPMTAVTIREIPQERLGL